MQRAVVCGAAGFIGGHLALRLKSEGYWVRGVDIEEPRYRPLDLDEFVLADLRSPEGCERALAGPCTDEVYQLAADMGGMEFICSAEREVLFNNSLVNLHMVDAAARAGVKRYFFSSSVCVYRDMAPGEPELDEDDAYPALPDNEYGWEKLYSERVVSAYERKYPMATRIARFQNCYGPYGAWRGGREKAPAAICRKVAESPDGGTIEAFGDGSAVRSFIFVEDLVDAVRRLMASDLDVPVNIGTREYVTVEELILAVAELAGKDIKVRWVEGPVGVSSRNFSNDLIESLGFSPRRSLRDGLALTYPWVAEQVLGAVGTTSS
ncbi:MAG TPA: NAD-dependent epimerase/dehydratase family protein [Acidimicrobiales bacterium]|nr:NAD-dependent epimerase/dehydratase family protein [Acidimicrobiales bacterium]